MFDIKGSASFLVGGQWGSEGKGAAAAWLAYNMAKQGQCYDIVTTDAAAQAGHTSIHKGKKRVVFHLPTVPLIAKDEGLNSFSYVNAGSMIDPEVLEQELKENGLDDQNFAIHPMAAVITEDCKEAERAADSSTTKIASTRKGVGEALARKAMRRGLVARDHPFLKQFVRHMDLNGQLSNGKSVLVEVPQGVSLSLNHSGFYPHTTSRDCTPMSGMSNAGIHPTFYGGTMVVLRTFPIRVGHIVEDGKTLGESGGFYSDQEETSWTELGVEAEITTVTKRVRRVFTFSTKQVRDTFALCRPDVVMLTFANYVKEQKKLDDIVDAINRVAKELWMTPPTIVYEWGPTTVNVGGSYEVA